MKKNDETQAPTRYYTENDMPVSMVHDLIVPYHSLFKSPLAKLGAIKQGLQPASLSALLKVTEVTQADIARWLDITEPTLRKHIQGDNSLNPGLSEHVIQLFELFDKGVDTFASLNEFKSWLRHYNPGIDAIPFDMLDTITGIGIVMSEIIRIDYGVTA
jgi:putative toxin-antitoxin system antitoxin component (TIGR02293 family)